MQNRIGLHKVDWLTVDKCPACDGSECSALGVLPVNEYQFGSETIPIPRPGAELLRCHRCSLVFKSLLPPPQLLAEVFLEHVGKGWADDYDFADEVDFVHSLVRKEPFDLLDIGTSNGGFLEALDGAHGRRSALDIFVHPQVSDRIRGEFILDLADAKDMAWSERPYDVVTMFDVLEHLYSPAQAFANLARLVKPGGFVVVETGDVDSPWPKKFGARHWWYTNSIAHHLFWSQRSFRCTASRYGFRMVHFIQKRQKEQSAYPYWRQVPRIAKTSVYAVSPTMHRRIARALGKSEMQPWSPLTQDHFRAVLYREP